MDSSLIVFKHTIFYFPRERKENITLSLSDLMFYFFIYITCNTYIHTCLSHSLSLFLQPERKLAGNLSPSDKGMPKHRLKFVLMVCQEQSTVELFFVVDIKLPNYDDDTNA